MKTLILFFTVTVSLSSFASGNDIIKNFLEQNEVADLEIKLAKKTEVYLVGITGFGNNQKVLIRKSK